MMARRYVRDNRGRFATTASGGATARGGRLRTAAGNKRATQTIEAPGRTGVIGKPRGLAPGSIKPKPKPASAPNAPKRLKFNLLYHGTTADAAKSIRQGGYRESTDGALGPGVYTSRSKKTAENYAAGAPVLAHRVPRSRMVKQAEVVDFAKIRDPRKIAAITDKYTATIRAGNAAVAPNKLKVALLGKDLADRTLVKPSSKIRRPRRRR